MEAEHNRAAKGQLITLMQAPAFNMGVHDLPEYVARQ
jgi:hypothetical protein